MGFLPLDLPLFLQPWKDTRHTHTPTGETGPLTDPGDTLPHGAVPPPTQPPPSGLGRTVSLVVPPATGVTGEKRSLGFKALRIPVGLRVQDWRAFLC